METSPENKKPLPESVRAELAALAEMSDEDIDLSDIPATTHEDWIGAVRGKLILEEALTSRGAAPSNRGFRCSSELLASKY